MAVDAKRESEAERVEMIVRKEVRVEIALL